MTNGAGFTLIELIVTMAVIGIVGMIAVPGLVPIGSSEDASSVVVRALSEAAQQAAQTSEPVDVLVDPTRGRIETRRHGLDSTIVTEFTSSNDEAVRISFLPSGRAAGGPVNLSDALESTVISVDPWTSRVWRRRQ